MRPIFVLNFAIHGLRTLFDMGLCSFLNCNSDSKGFGTPGKYFWPPLYIEIYIRRKKGVSINTNGKIPEGQVYVPRLEPLYICVTAEI